MRLSGRPCWAVVLALAKYLRAVYGWLEALWLLLFPAIGALAAPVSGTECNSGETGSHTR